MDDQYYLDEEDQHYDQDYHHRYYSKHQHYNDQQHTRQSPHRRDRNPQQYYEDHPSVKHDYYPSRREKQRPTREQLAYEQLQYEKKQRRFQRQLQLEKLLHQHQKQKQQRQQEKQKHVHESNHPKFHQFEKFFHVHQKRKQQQQHEKQKHVHESNHPTFHRRGRSRIAHPALAPQIPFDTYMPPHPVAAPQYTFDDEKMSVHQPQQQTYIQQMEQRNKQKQVFFSGESNKNNRNRSKSKKKGPEKKQKRSSKSPKRNHKNKGKNSANYDRKKTTAATRIHNYNHTGGGGAGRSRSVGQRTSKKRSRIHVRPSKSLESRRTPWPDNVYPAITQSSSYPVSEQSSESGTEYDDSQSPKRGAMKSQIYNDQSYDYNNDRTCCTNNFGANGVYENIGSLSSSSSIDINNPKEKKGGRIRFNADPEVDNGCCGAYGSACKSECQNTIKSPLTMLGGILLIVILFI